VYQRPDVVRVGSEPQFAAFWLAGDIGGGQAGCGGRGPCESACTRPAAPRRDGPLCG